MIRRLLCTMTKASQHIKVSEPARAGIIQLNRPDALNAVNLDMFRTLYQLLKKLELEKDVVIFKGLGKVFTAGGDVKQIASLSVEDLKKGYRDSNRSSDLIFNYQKPYVALMDGLAMGGATYYSLPGKYCVTTERTVYSMPETAIGYFNDAGSSYFLPRLSNNFGFYLGMTGARVKGFDLKKVGLATHYIESAKLDEVETEIVSCKTHEEVARVLDKFSSIAPSTASELDKIMPVINNCFGAATVEDIFENLKSDGSEFTTKTLKH